MDVLLINPPTTADIETQRTLGLKAPPLGLAYIAAVLEREGHRVRIVDAPALDYTFQDVQRHVKLEQPDVVGITSTTPTIYDAMRTAEAVKEADPDIKVLIGGPHVTFLAEETLQECPHFDVAVIGEGEVTACELMRAFEKGTPLKEIKGIAFRSEDKVIVTPPRPLIQNLDEIPFPARHLLPMDKYTVLGQQTVIGHVMSSRGCPFRCIFCSSSRIFGKVWRGRSPKNVVDEIEELCDKWKAKHIEFADDTFTLNMKRAEEISKEIIRRGLDIFWACGARVDTLRRELVQWMKKAGCHVIYIGVESGSQRILNLLKKGIRLEQVIKAVKWLKEAGMEITASYVIGTPGETKEEVERTIKFAVKLDTDFAQFTAMTPYPGTEVYEYAKREGLLLTNDWSKFTTIKPVMRTKELSAEEIEKLVSKAYRKFYLRPKFLWRQLKKGRLPLIFLVLKNYLSGKKASPSS